MSDLIEITAERDAALARAEAAEADVARLLEAIDAIADAGVGASYLSDRGNFETCKSIAQEARAALTE